MFSTVKKTAFLLASSFFLLAASPKPQAVPKISELEVQFRGIMKEDVPTFVVATAPSLFSFDPLKADFARNIDTMRLLYATPLEMDTEGQFSSTVLDHFYFDSKDNKVIFQAKPGVRYEDGTLISIDDIGMAIKRVLYSHTKGPVIKDIRGKDQWLKEKNPLTTYPEGIKVNREKGIIEIYFSNPVQSPLFRFSKEWFSVIPSSCIDPITNTLKCEKPSFSGRYKLSDNILSKSTSKVFFPVFIKLESRVPDVPKYLWIAFMSPTRIIEYANDFNEKTVIKANEIDIPNFQKETLEKKLKVYMGPKTLYSVITLNSKAKTFENKRVRQYFAMKFRESIKDYGFEPEGSIFTNLLIGYIPLSDLNKMIPPFSEKEEVQILEHLKKYPPVFLKDEGTLLHPFTYILSATLKKMNLPEVQPLEKGEFDELWDKGMISIRPASCGFYPIDPSGDIRDTFTPVAHRFVVLDKKVSDLVSQLKHNDKLSHEVFNRHIFEDSKMVITTNYSRVFFMSKESTLYIAYGISGPQPWFFFRNLK